jgi:hypothetical protein
MGETAPRAFELWPNDKLVGALRNPGGFSRDISTVVIERIQSYGMAVGEEVFETVFWTGRFAEAAVARGYGLARLGRLKVKTTLCHDSRARDANIRAELINRFGPGKEKAIGTKRQPGPLYGVSGDVWSALAVAVAWADGAR